MKKLIFSGEKLITNASSEAPKASLRKHVMGGKTYAIILLLFSMLLYWYAPTGDTQTIYWRRHQLTFAFFAFSVFIFFLIGKKIFKDWKIGLLGSLFLIISPRIFAHSFYNPKDIPFLSAYIIAIYTLCCCSGKEKCLHCRPARHCDWSSYAVSARPG